MALFELNAVHESTCHPGELLAVLLAREPVTEGDVGPGVAIGVHQGFVQGVVPELVGVRRRQRVDVQDEDRP